jgi:hypothetical protein
MSKQANRPQKVSSTSAPYDDPAPTAHKYGVQPTADESLNHVTHFKAVFHSIKGNKFQRETLDETN